MMDLTENFLKLIQIALVVVGALALFFSYINYNITVDARSAEREALILGNALLSSDCLTYSDTKSLFSEDKLINMQTDSSCLKKQYPYGNVKVELQDSTAKWQIDIGPTNLGGESKFNVAVRNATSGIIKPALMTVYV